MLPQYERLLNQGEKPIYQIKFGKFAVIVVCLPFFSFIFCVIWSLLFYFERSTATHCNIDNYLPSISAAIGNYQPQQFVWQLSIVLHIIPRLIVTKMYLEYYNEIIRMNRRPLANLICFLNVIENLALLSLSLFTSSDYYEIHKFSFIIFIVTSEIYMFLSYLLNKNGRKYTIRNNLEEISLKHKRNLFGINLLSFCLAGYFFVRHNLHCEQGVYTMFAFFEYIVVLTNMGYHMTAYWDFSGRNLAFDWVRGAYFTFS